MEGEGEGEVGGGEEGRGEGREVTVRGQWDTPDQLGIICN